MFKKISVLFLSLILVVGLAACGAKDDTLTNQNNSTNSNTHSASTPQNSEGESNPTTSKEGKNLVVYFSMPETTKPDNMKPEEEYSTVVINGEVLGNTQYVAYVIQQNTNADIFRIEPTTPYPMDHAELEEVATKEKRDNAMPEISATVENIEQYDTIFLGHPNWYADMPRIIYSFLDQYDLSGKTIVPFVTSGGSGFSNTISTITDLEPNATVIKDGFSVNRNSVADAEQDIIKWLGDLGYTK